MCLRAFLLLFQLLIYSRPHINDLPPAIGAARGTEGVGKPRFSARIAVRGARRLKPKVGTPVVAVGLCGAHSDDHTTYYTESDGKYKPLEFCCAIYFDIGSSAQLT